MTIEPETLAMQPQAARRSGRRPVRLAIVLVLLLAMIGGGLLLYRQVLRDRYIAPRAFAVVETGRLYRSGQISSQLIRQTLQQHQIKVIVVMMGHDGREPNAKTEKQAAAELGIARHHCPLAGDGTGKWIRYAEALDYIARAEKANQPVLVHCNAGTQRTGGVIALYRVLLQKRQAAEAYRELIAAGHDPTDNPDLVPFLNRHMGEIAGELVRRGVISEAPSPLPVLQP